MTERYSVYFTDSGNQFIEEVEADEVRIEQLSGNGVRRLTAERHETEPRTKNPTETETVVEVTVGPEQALGYLLLDGE